MEDKLTHDWMLKNGFHHHAMKGINLYDKNGSFYVHNEDEPFCLRIRNEIRHKPVDSITDFLELHRIITP